MEQGYKMEKSVKRVSIESDYKKMRVINESRIKKTNLQSEVEWDVM